jgi:uncharacterized protein YoxC
MPDQRSAASQHALLQEMTAPLASLPDDPVATVAEVDFPLTLRGYDRLAVDAYVKRTSQLVAELQATRSPEAAVRRALERVGEEVSSILQRAHEIAAEITAQSRREADERLDRARAEAAEITAAAERRLRELDAETDRIWAERDRLVEDVREIAERLERIADAAGERLPADETEGERLAVHETAGERLAVDQTAGERLPADADFGELDATQGPEPAPRGAREEEIAAGEHSGEPTVILPARGDREARTEEKKLDDEAS